jgi:hypothetical protein
MRTTKLEEVAEESTTMVTKSTGMTRAMGTVLMMIAIRKRGQIMNRWPLKLII